MEHEQARSAWERFGCLVANDLRLLALGSADFHSAAMMTLDAASALRADDTLHLACAVQAGATSIATLDEVLGRNAQQLNIKPVAFP